MDDDFYILGIESSCDDTSVAITNKNHVLSNIISSQLVHNQYGGVVPEIASREHMKNIVPVLKKALEESKIDLNQRDRNKVKHKFFTYNHKWLILFTQENKFWN